MRLLWLIPAIQLMGIGTGIANHQQASAKPLPSIRFLLTFDDGPSSELEDNPTARIADTLAKNPVQPGIKAVFFVQSRLPEAGGSAFGRRLLRRLAAEDHVLGLHSGSCLGHVEHTEMSTEELAGSLSDGISDLRAIASQPPALVRPPYWTYDRDTLSAYRRAGLAMLLTDVLARDGGPTLFQANPDRGSWILLTGLIKVREHLARRHLPQVGDAVPVVMTFHDTNRYTSEHLSEYLSTLIQQAREAGLRVANPPFYSDRAALIQAARARAELGIF